MWVAARFRVCDDESGGMLAEVAESRRAGGRTLARTVFNQSLTSSSERCTSHRLDWRLAGDLRGAGVYRVTLRVRDAQGAWSNRVASSFPTSPPKAAG